MSTCRACGAECRITMIALVTERGRAKSGRVCQECARKGLLICAKVTPTIIAPRKPTKKSARDLLRPIIKTLEAQLKAATMTAPVMNASQGGAIDDFLEGRKTALEGVIATLKGVES